MDKKTCRTCKIEKPILDYYQHKYMSDGHLNICKTCIKSNVEKLRTKKLKDPFWAEKEQERQRKKAERRRCQFPEKTSAHNACKSLQIDRNTHLHHWSYLEEHWTNVFPVDVKDHRIIHSQMIYDGERMMYRKIPDLELLDTSDKAKEFYEKLLNKPVNLLE
jgi:hypothetical protein